MIIRDPYTSPGNYDRRHNNLKLSKGAATVHQGHMITIKTSASVINSARNALWGFRVVRTVKEET